MPLTLHVGVLPKHNLKGKPRTGRHASRNEFLLKTGKTNKQKTKKKKQEKRPKQHWEVPSCCAHTKLEQTQNSTDLPAECIPLTQKKSPEWSPNA